MKYEIFDVFGDATSPTDPITLLPSFADFRTRGCSSLVIYKDSVSGDEIGYYLSAGVVLTDTLTATGCLAALDSFINSEFTLSNRSSAVAAVLTVKGNGFYVDVMYFVAKPEVHRFASYSLSSDRPDFLALKRAILERCSIARSVAVNSWMLSDEDRASSISDVIEPNLFTITEGRPA